MAIEKKQTDAMFSLAKYYEDQKDYDNMIKYYKIAIDENDDEALAFLLDYYKKINDHDNVIKYYLVAINKKIENAAKELNEYLKINFKIEHALKCKDYLTYENHQKLNNLFVKFYQIYDLDLEHNKIECYICLENNYAINYKCNCNKTNVCFKCYNKIKLCPICKEKI